MLSMVIGFLNIGTSEMLFIVFIALLLFGGKKLPELARGLGRGIREFKDASETIKRDISEQINNFEKDIEVKDMIVDDLESEVDSALPPATKPEDKVNSPAPVAHQFSAPSGTFQHNPGREPDYYGSEGAYYHDSTPDDTNDIPGGAESKPAAPQNPAKEEEKPV